MELSARGLDTKGKKAELEKRLADAKSKDAVAAGTTASKKRAPSRSPKKSPKKAPEKAADEPKAMDLEETPVEEAEDRPAKASKTASGKGDPAQTLLHLHCTDSLRHTR